MTGFPINPPNTPLVMADGRTCSPEWYRFFRDIQNLIGGDTAPWDDSSLLTASVPAPPLPPSEEYVDLTPPQPIYEPAAALVPPAIPVPHDDRLEPYSDPRSASLGSISSFMWTLLDDADAATARTTLAISGNLALVSDAASAIVFSFAVGATTYYLQAGTGTLAANTTSTITFPQAFATRAFCVVSGGDSDTTDEGDIVAYSVSTTAASIKNSANGVTGSYWWIALGY